MFAPAVSTSKACLAGVAVRPTVSVRAVRAAPIAARAGKASEFRSLSVDEIDAKVADLKKELFGLRIKQKTRQELKTHSVAALRKDVARLLTVRREKTDGNKREAQAAEKNAQLDAGVFVR